MARNGTLTRKDFEEAALALRDLAAAAEVTVADSALSRLQVATQLSLQTASCVKTLARVLSRSSTTFDMEKFLALTRTDAMNQGQIYQTSGRNGA